MENFVIDSIVNNTFYDGYINNGYNRSTQERILDFHGYDSKELFEYNLKKKPENWFYRKNSVKYTLNSLGYRTKEFDDIDWKNSIVIFGCSLVFGTGVDDEHTIPYFLEQISGIPVVNLGIGSASIQTSLHNGIILSDSKYSIPKAIVSFWTQLNRHQIYGKKYINLYGSWNEEHSPLCSSKYHNISQNLMNIKMFRNLWKNKTIYYETTMFKNQINLINKLDKNFICDTFDYLGRSEFCNARDDRHFGPTTNFLIAKKIYEKIKPQLEL